MGAHHGHHIVGQAQCALVGQGDLVVSKDSPDIHRHHRRRRNLRRRRFSSQRAIHLRTFTGNLGQRPLVVTTQCRTCLGRSIECSSQCLDTMIDTTYPADITSQEAANLRQHCHLRRSIPSTRLDQTQALAATLQRQPRLVATMKQDSRTPIALVRPATILGRRLVNTNRHRRQPSLTTPVTMVQMFWNVPQRQVYHLK